MLDRQVGVSCFLTVLIDGTCFFEYGYQNSTLRFEMSIMDNDIKLPSNKKFGLLFTIVCIVATGYFLNHKLILVALAFGFCSIIFLVLSLFNSSLLSPLNRYWMRLGQLLGMVVSPVVLGVIFFGIFTPIAISMRLFGRDELRIKLMRSPSYWITGINLRRSGSFYQQF